MAKSVRHPGALTPSNHDGGGPDPAGCVEGPPRAHGTASPCGRRPWRWRPAPHGAPRQLPDPGQLIRRHSPGLVDPAALAPQPRPATVEEPTSGQRRRPSPTVPLSIQIQALVILFFFSLCLLERMPHFLILESSHLMDSDSIWIFKH